MSHPMSLCSLLVMAAAVALIVFSFIGIFERQKAGESDSQVIQRQLRGFALLIVANLVMGVGMALCAGSLFPQLQSLF